MKDTLNLATSPIGLEKIEEARLNIERLEKELEGIKKILEFGQGLLEEQLLKEHGDE